MNKLTEAEFLDFYSKAYGGLTDKLGQIAYHKFTGEELFEFVNDAIEYKSKQKVSSGVEKELGDFYSHSSKIMNVHTSRLNTLFDLMLKKKVNKPK